MLVPAEMRISCRIQKTPLRGGTVRTRHLKRYFAAVILMEAAWVLGSSEICATDRHTPSIIFRFRPVQIDGRSAFHADENFRVRQAETEIIVPTHWGSAAHLERQTQNLKVNSPGASLTDHPKDAGEKLLHARPGERIDLSYDIVPQQTEWFRSPQEHMAIINEDYFVFNPENALVYPEMPNSEEVDVTFDWHSLPKDIPIVTSFGMSRSGENGASFVPRHPGSGFWTGCSLGVIFESSRTMPTQRRWCWRYAAYGNSATRKRSAMCGASLRKRTASGARRRCRIFL
jgi:hypothetical protein